MGRFDDLLNLAGNFVEKQKGMWDHTAWNKFLADIQSKGLKLNQDIEGKLGLTLETMKKYYSAASNSHGITNTLNDIWTKTSEFIKKTNGVWDHAAWEKYISDLKAKGHTLTDETIGYIGAILEASKELYVNIPESMKKAETITSPNKTPKTKKAVLPTEASPMVSSNAKIIKPAVKTSSSKTIDSKKK